MNSSNKSNTSIKWIPNNNNNKFNYNIYNNKHKLIVVINRGFWNMFRALESKSLHSIPVVMKILKKNSSMMRISNKIFNLIKINNRS